MASRQTSTPVTGLVTTTDLKLGYGLDLNYSHVLNNGVSPGRATSGVVSGSFPRTAWPQKECRVPTERTVVERRNATLDVEATTLPSRTVCIVFVDGHVRKCDVCAVFDVKSSTRLHRRIMSKRTTHHRERGAVPDENATAPSSISFDNRGVVGDRTDSAANGNVASINGAIVVKIAIEQLERSAP